MNNISVLLHKSDNKKKESNKNIRWLYCIFIYGINETTLLAIKLNADSFISTDAQYSATQVSCKLILLTHIIYVIHDL